jgi:carbon monoxide dehydrogenase subunit G
MTRAELSIAIDRDPAEVFAFVSDPANNPKWRSYVIESSWLDDGPMRVGRRGYQTSRILGRTMSVEAVIVEWDPPHAVTWQAVQGSATVRSWVRVEPDGAGCVVSGGAEGEFNGFVMRLLTPLGARMMVRDARASLQKLKAALESRTEGSLP